MEEIEPKGSIEESAVASEAAEGSGTRWSYQERRRAVRDMRLRLGLSQVKLAALAEVDPFTISRFENGKQDVKQSTLTRIEEALAGVQAALRQYGGAHMTEIAHTVEHNLRLAEHNLRLNDEIGHLKKMIVLLERNLETTSKLNEVLEELNTIQEAALVEFEKTCPQKSEEAAALLARAKTLAEVVKK